MKFSAPKNHKIGEIPIPIIATPNSKNGNFMINDTVDVETAREIGITNVPTYIVEAVRRGRTEVMARYVVREATSPPLYRFDDCAAIIKTQMGSRSIRRAIETS